MRQFPATRDTDPETSFEAAEKVAKGANLGRKMALEALFKRPMTDYELADETGWQQNSIGKRRGELVERGLVEVCVDGEGNKVKRPAPSGANSLVWRLSQAGMDLFCAKVAIALPQQSLFEME